MADNYEDDYEDEYSNDSDLVKNLRKQVRALGKELSEIKSENTNLKTVTRETSIKNVLNAKGVNAKVAKLIPANIEGEEAVTEWLEENADIFGFTAPSEADAETQSSSVSEEAVSSTKRLQNLGQNSQSPTAVQDIEAKVANAKSQKEILAILAEGNQAFI